MESAMPSADVCFVVSSRAFELSRTTTSGAAPVVAIPITLAVSDCRAPRIEPLADRDAETFTHKRTHEPGIQHGSGARFIRCQHLLPAGRHIATHLNAFKRLAPTDAGRPRP